jgi:ankyrin repeat protein
MVVLLLENGAEVDAKVHGWTPMLLATKAWRFRVRDYLVERGAEVNARDYYRQRALHWAAKHGGEAFVQLLLERGAEIDARDHLGETAYQ